MNIASTMPKPTSQLLTNPHGFIPLPFALPIWLKNPHLQTILPKFFAPSVPDYRRVLVKDSFDKSDVAYDFYDADEQIDSSHLTDSEPVYQTPLVVLFHGMEGNSESHYARALAHRVHAQGWHFVVPHFRSCGGVPAQGKVFYTAADTAEVHHSLRQLAKQYATIYAVGVSLGGNALSKYMGEYGDDAICQRAVVASAPVEMASAAIKMQQFVGQRIYTPYLLNPIIKKALANDLQDDEIYAIKSTNHISDFDHIFTAPRHGYRSVNDYYRKASALPHLINVKKPLLLVSAKDDPFLGFMAKSEDVSDMVTLLETTHGGHIGFLRYQNHKFDINWLPQTVIAFFQHIIE